LERALFEHAGPKATLTRDAPLMANETKPVAPRPPAQHLPFLTLVLLLLMAFYATQGPVRAWLSGRYRAEATFDAALRTVLDEYVDPRTPSELVHGAIDGMVKSLGDPHSAYLSPTDNEHQGEVEKGRYPGIGVLIDLQNGKVVVAQVFDDSPASRAGLRPGDILLAANGRDLANVKSLDKVIALIRGRKGTVITLTLRRDSQKLEVPVIREEIQRPVVEHRLLSDGLGYLRIGDFPDGVSRTVETALKDLQERGMRGLVLDLRSNNGGFLDEAVRTADLFIAEGVIVTTRGRHERDNKIFRAEPGGLAEKVPMVVLVNAGTASAAEVLAGALRDHGRARLVGTRTYGKGTVNKRFPLPDGSGLLISTGKYFLPKGEQIEGKGLDPDQLVEGPTREELSKLPPGTPPPDRQLAAAVKMLTEQLAPG